MAQTKHTEDSALIEKEKIGKQVFGIGLNASLTSGMGVSFKHHLGGIPFAYQISGGFLQLGESQIYSIGLELQYDINVKQTDRLFVCSRWIWAVLCERFYKDEYDGPSFSMGRRCRVRAGSFTEHQYLTQYHDHRQAIRE
jgi:hypothetical protein